jgi:hypothetical protein
MAAIRIRKTIDSDTLHLPELRPFIGQTVDITVEGPPLDPAERAARMKEILDHIAATRITSLAPGTPDSTEMLREDRER